MTMSHKRSPHQAAHGKAHGRSAFNLHDGMHPHGSATKHTPRSAAGSKPAHPTKDAFAKRMRRLEGAHGSGQDMEAERREKRLTGKSV
jgi:hypothetical protein